MTIGNIPFNIRSSLEKMAFVVVAFLPITPKKTSTDSANVNAKYKIGIQEVLAVILKSGDLRSWTKNGVILDCADGFRRLSHPIVCGWMGDHPEKMNLLGLKTNLCSDCEVTHKQLGIYPNSAPRRDPERYKNQIAEHGGLNKSNLTNLVGMVTIPKAIWSLRYVNANEIFKPDLLHEMYIGMLRHVLDWVIAFLKKHKRIGVFNTAWEHVPPYPNFRNPKKSYEAVKQWTGYEYRDAGRILLPILVLSLRSPPPTPQEHQIFKRVLLCVRNFVDFSLICQFKSHSDQTIKYMEQYLEGFHSYKDVFLEFRAGKKAKLDARMAAGEVREMLEEVEGTVYQRRKAKEDIRRNAQETGTQSAIDGSHFNFPKMHALCHMSEYISRFGNLNQWSTEVSESLHRHLVKQAYNRTNHKDFFKQIIDYIDRNRNLRLMKARLNKNAESTPKDSKKTKNAPNHPFSALFKSINIRTLNDISRDRNLPNLCEWVAEIVKRDCALVSTLRADIFQKLSIDSVFPEYQEYRVDQSLYVNCNINNSTKSLSDDFDSAKVCVVWYCNPEDRRLRMGPDSYGALNGRLPAFVRLLFRVYVSSILFWDFVIVDVLDVTNSGKIILSEGVPFVENRKNRLLRLCQPSHIVGLAHLIPFSPPNSSRTDLPNSDLRWIVNSRIDLNTFGWCFSDGSE